MLILIMDTAFIFIAPPYRSFIFFEDIWSKVIFIFQDHDLILIFKITLFR